MTMTRAISPVEVFLRLTGSAVRRQTADRLLGWVWWLVDPLVMVAVYAVVFSQVLGVGRVASHDAYPLFLACALIPWRWFAIATQKASGALSQNSALLTSLPTSREAVVLSELAGVSLQALVGFPVLVVFMVFYQSTFNENLALIVLPVLVLGVLSLGASYLLSPLAVLMPDISNLWSIVLRVGWFASPGLYGFAQVPAQYQSLYMKLNPMVGIIEGIRRPIHDGLPPLWEPLAWSALWALVLLLVGRIVFRRTVDRCVRML